MDKLVYTVAEAAYKLNCSTGVVYKLIHSSQLDWYKNGKVYLVTLESLQAYIRRKTVHN